MQKISAKVKIQRIIHRSNKTSIIKYSLILIFLTYIVFNITINKENLETIRKYLNLEYFLHLPEITTELINRNEKKEAIFFIESTGNGFIKSRYICSLESAAKLHPNSDIYLLFVYSPPVLNMTLNHILWNVINKYNNIIPLYIDMNILFKNSILESFLQSNKLENSTFKAVHTSDVIRIFILYKYGGKYLDLDTILVNNISHLKNFITFMYPTRTQLANGILGLEKYSSIALHILNNIDKNWKGDSWLHNGPQLLNNAMYDYCNKCAIINMTSQNCKGFTILEHPIFFPLPYYDLLEFFYEDKNGKIMEKIKNVTNLLGIHISNSLVFNRTINIGSKQPYSLLAREYCPITYNSCNSTM